MCAHNHLPFSSIQVLQWLTYLGVIFPPHYPIDFTSKEETFGTMWLDIGVCVFQNAHVLLTDNMLTNLQMTNNHWQHDAQLLHKNSYPASSWCCAGTLIFWPWGVLFNLVYLKILPFCMFIISCSSLGFEHSRDLLNLNWWSNHF